MRAPRASRVIEGDGVVRWVPRDAGQITVDGLDQSATGRRVISVRGQRLGDNHTRSVDTQMELLPPALAASTVFRGGPLPFAHDRQSRAVDDEMKALVRADPTNTVSHAYADSSLSALLEKVSGTRLKVRANYNVTDSTRPELDALINRAILLARQHGYTLQQLRQRVQERLLLGPPDHLLHGRSKSPL